MKRTSRTVLAKVLLFGAALALLTACGRDPSDTADGKGSTEDDRAKMLAYVECMRDNGVDMPDPEFDASGRGGVFINGDMASEATTKAAEEACKSLREAAFESGGPKRSPEETKEEQERLLAYSQCMRENGVNMPDPQFDGDKVTVRMEDNGTPPDEATMATAEAACAGLMPDGAPMTRRAPGGPGGPGSGPQTQGFGTNGGGQ